MKIFKKLFLAGIVCMAGHYVLAQEDTLYINDAGFPIPKTKAVFYRVISPSDSGGIEIREYFINDTLHSVTHYSTKLATVKQGNYILYHSDGSLSCQGAYRKGFQTGEWIYYDEKGRRIMERRFYADPSRAYYCIRYDPYTYRKHSEGYMDEHERKTGSWKEYHKNSDAVKLLSNYICGIREGEQLEFFENGKCRRREIIRDKKSVKSIQFDENGKEVPFFPAFIYPVPPYPVKRALAGISCVDSLLKSRDIHYMVRVHKDGSISGIEITIPVSVDCQTQMIAAIQKMKRWKPARYENEPIDYAFEGVIRYYGPRE